MTNLTMRNISAPITAQQVEAVRFTPVRLSVGYGMDEVDSFLDDVVATLRGDTHRQSTTSSPGRVPLTVDDVNQKRFGLVRLRAGYAIDEVDQLLDVIAKTIAMGRVPAADDTPAGHALGPTTVCGTCFALVLVSDEGLHRGWHGAAS